MKKIILVFAICLGVSFMLNSCKTEKKEDVITEEIITEGVEELESITENVEVIGEVETKEIASNTLYQCPMDCEKGKSYIKEGSCPVCKMNLKPKEVDLAGEGERIMKDSKIESTPNN